MDEITTHEAAEVAAVKPSTVHRWLTSGRIAFRWAEGRRVLHRADLDRFLAAREVVRGR